MTEATFHVSNMVCEGCKAAVAAAVRSTDGALDVRIDLEEKLVHVDYDGAKISAEDIRDAIEGAGYRATQE